MPGGILANVAAIFFGGIIGASIANRIPKSIRERLPLVFGVCAMTMAITGLIRAKTLPMVILALILGTVVGELISFDKWITRAGESTKDAIEKVLRPKIEGIDRKTFDYDFINIFIIACASGTAIYGALEGGITGDFSILYSKAVLDVFSAAIFASTLGYVVCAICIPQTIVLMSLFFAARLIMPLTTPLLLDDFSACGSAIILATGMRVARIQDFPIANMVPAMVLVMPLSYLWNTYVPL